MKKIILTVLNLIIIASSSNSIALEVKTNKFCSTDSLQKPIKNELYKIYETTLYQNFKDVLVLKNFPAKQIPMFFCISKLESNFNTNAVNLNDNGTIDSGLFQINEVWEEQCHYKMYTTEDNIDCAILIYKKQGFNAWTTYRKYRNFCENAYNIFKYKNNQI